MPGRTLKITYGAFEVGAGTSYDIDGPWRWDSDYQTGTLTATVVVTAADASGLESACSDLEAAYRTPWQNLQVEMAGQTFLSYSHSGNTGFSGEASARKTGSQTDTARSREYAITVRVFFPADLAGQNGRRNARVNITHSPSDRLTVSFTGEWTALGSSDALEQYTGQSKLWATSYLQSKFSNRVFELITDRVTPDDQDKVATFEMVYQEIIYNQSSGTLDDPQLVGEQLSFAISRENPGDSPSSSLASSLGLGTGAASRPYTLVASVSANVNKNETQDLDTVWTSKLRPYLLSQTQVATGVAGVLAVVNETYTPDYANNTIQGSLTIIATQGGLLSYQVMLAYNDSTGATPVWAHSNSPEAAYIVQGPRVLSRTVTTQYRALTGAGVQGGGGGAGRGGGNAAGAPGGGAGGIRAEAQGIIDDINGAYQSVGGTIQGAANLILSEINSVFDSILGGSSGQGIGTSNPNVNQQAGGGGGNANNAGGGEEFGLQLGAEGLSWLTVSRTGNSTPRIIGKLRSFNVLDISRGCTQVAFAPIDVDRGPSTQGSRGRPPITQGGAGAAGGGR